jgi:GDP-L-fucose synthase
MEISIRDLAIRIAELSNFQGQLIWDADKPDGQPRRSLDTTKAEKLFGFRAGIPFKDGLRQTIDWFRNQAAGNSGS